MNAESTIHHNVTREFRHGTRGESAARCIGPITKGCEIFGLTKGDFSMIDILRHIAREIGPCRIDIGTWTAAAAKIVTQDRNASYGGPERSFETIAQLWAIHLGYKVTASDVAIMMALLKIARLSANPAHADSWIDLAGYAACGGEVSLTGG